MAKDTERDVREEIKVALFWRALIGDYEYIKFNPDDMFRWYEALELRGPGEIRDVISERYSTRPMPAVLGIVNVAPHPPTWLVREWLAHHEEQVPVSGYIWKGMAAFTGLCFMLGPFVYGCSQLQPVNPYYMKPPTQTAQVSQPTLAQPKGATGSMTTPQAFTPSATGPVSSGIAGSTGGGSPASGLTGPSNGGISAGAAMSTPSSGAVQN